MTSKWTKFKHLFTLLEVPAKTTLLQEGAGGTFVQEAYTGTKTFLLISEKHTTATLRRID
jgi:hypothetical protein